MASATNILTINIQSTADPFVAAVAVLAFHQSLDASPDAPLSCSDYWTYAAAAALVAA